MLMSVGSQVKAKATIDGLANISDVFEGAYASQVVAIGVSEKEFPKVEKLNWLSYCKSQATTAFSVLATQIEDMALVDTITSTIKGAKSIEDLNKVNLPDSLGIEFKFDLEKPLFFIDKNLDAKSEKVKTPQSSKEAITESEKTESSS